MSFLKNRTVVGVICILLSLLICFGLTPLFNQAVSQRAEIVRVVQPIRAGDEITADMVQAVEVGGYNLPEDVIRQTETAVGRYATADLAVGDYIISSKLSDVPAADNAYLYDLDGTQQAISVSIKSFAEGLSGKLQSGDIVSVIAPDYQQLGQTVVPAELQYVEVISVTASSGYDANTGETPEDGEDRELPDTVTLLVYPEQAKVLAELEAEGTIHLSLVYRGDRENADQFLDAQVEVLNELYPSEPDPEEVPADPAAPSEVPETAEEGTPAYDSAVQNLEVIKARWDNALSEADEALSAAENRTDFSDEAAVMDAQAAIEAAESALISAQREFEDSKDEELYAAEKNIEAARRALKKAQENMSKSQTEAEIERVTYKAELSEKEKLRDTLKEIIDNGGHVMAPVSGTVFKLWKRVQKRKRMLK